VGGELTCRAAPCAGSQAFIADKWNDARFRNRWKSRFGMVSREENVRHDLLPSEMLLEVKKPDGTPLEGPELIAMIKQLRRTTSTLAQDEEKAVNAVYHQMVAQQPKSRAYYRVNATRMITASQAVQDKPVTLAQVKAKSFKSFTNKVGPSAVALPEAEPIKAGHSVVEWAAESYAIVEAAGTVTVQVVRAGDSEKEVSVEYETIDGSAVAGSDYEGSAGTLTFKPGQTSHDITIKIFDDDEIEPDEEFSIALKGIVSGDASLGPIASTRVTVINDDFPGTFCCEEEQSVKESCGTCKISVERVQGCSGAVTMAYRTVDGTAIHEKNFGKCEGELSWAHQDVEPKVIEVPIVDDDLPSGNLYFEVELHSATGASRPIPYMAQAAPSHTRVVRVGCVSA